MWFLSLVFSTRCHLYLPCTMLKQSLSVLIMVEILLMRTKNKAICVIRSTQMECYGNAINLWKHLISRIKRHDLHNEWQMARHFVYYTHTKARMTLAEFSSSAVSLYDDINTWISSPAALRVISLAFYCLIWENYHHITWYTAAASFSRQPVKIKV